MDILQEVECYQKIILYILLLEDKVSLLQLNHKQEQADIMVEAQLLIEILLIIDAQVEEELPIFHLLMDYYHQLDIPLELQTVTY